MLFLSLFISVKISSVVNERMGANHLTNDSKIIFKTIILLFLFSESLDHNTKCLFLYQNKKQTNLQCKNLIVLYKDYESHMI